MTVDFSVDNTEGCGTIQSLFTDLSTTTSGTISSWSWEIGEVNSSLQNPGRVFTDIGSYTVCLTATDSNGNSAKLCKENLINLYEKPTADFSVDETIGCAPLTVNFLDLSSSPNGEIVSWVWGLGGDAGTLETNDEQLQVVSTYNVGGFYTATLQVTDEKGCMHTVTKLDAVEVEKKPEILVGTAEEVDCKFPQVVDFENFGVENDVIYEWDFGNGQSFVGYNPDPITYNNSGNYDVVVTSRFTGSTCTEELVLEDYISEGGAIEFDFFPKSGCSGLQVQFEDNSSIEAENWTWDFGDGTTSQERDPTHRYQNPGTYTISLYRKTSECEGTKVALEKVTVSSMPSVSGSYDIPAACILPSKVQLRADGDGSSNYLWLIGEPGDYIAELSGKNVELQLEDYGKYRVSLVVQNSNGCSAAKVLDSIEIAPLEVEILGDLDGCIPFTSQLSLGSNSSSPLTIVSSEFSNLITTNPAGGFVEVEITEIGTYGFQGIFENDLGCKDTLNLPSLLRGGPAPMVDFEVSDSIVCPQQIISFNDLSSGDIDSWEWSIGDSLTFLDQNLKADLSLPGTYDVKLTIGSNGCFVSKTLDDYIKVRPPGTNFRVEYNCEDPKSVLAINTSSSADESEWSYTIGMDTIRLQDEDSLRITFPEIGDYLLSLNAFNEASGCQNILGQRIELTQPEASFEVDNFEGCAPLAINFTDKSKDAIEWEYIPSGGSFSNPTGPNTNLTLRFGAEYDNIGLIVTDIHGCTDTTFSSTIKVNALRSVIAAPSPICFSDTLSIANFSSSTFGTITDYQWILGNNLDTSNLETAEFTAPDIGKFDIRLRVEDDLGCVDSTTLRLGAFFRAPNFELVADTLACTTGNVRFRNALHTGGYNYIWNFGDGNSSTEINPEHLYESEGDYLVNVVIEDSEKCVNNMQLNKRISVFDPRAEFTVDSTFAACPPLISTFTNLSDNAVEYSWDFGDDTGLGISETPSHLYSYGGIFDVELVAIRSENCRDTFKIEELIQLNGPNGQISFEVDSSCVPLLVNFEADLDEEYNMTWDFGDGNLLTEADATNYASTMHSYGEVGNFIPKIILTNSENCTIIRTGEKIQTHDLEARFTLTDSSFCNFIPTSVDLFSTAESSSPIKNVSWIVSGAENVTLQGHNTSFSPSQQGFSTITMIAESDFCKDTVTVDSILKIGDSPILTLESDTFTCLGNPVEITNGFPAGLTSMNWSNSFGPIETATFLPQEDQYYYLSVENSFDCESRDSILIEVVDDQTRFAGADRTICQGAETIVNIDYGEQTFWPDLPDCNSCNEVALSPNQKSNYVVEVINDFGCLVKDTLVVDVLTPQDIDAGEDQRICRSENAILLGYAPGVYSWQPTQLLSNPNNQLTTATLTETTLFTLTSTVDECTLRDSILVELIEKAELETKGDTTCYGEIADLYAGGNVDHITWMEDATLSSLEVRNPTSNTTETKTYRVIGQLEGCQPDTSEVQVIVHPEIQVTLPQVRNYFKGITELELSLKLVSSGDYQISWNPSEVVSCSSCEQTSARVDGSDIDLIATIMDRNTGCTVEKTVMLRQLEECAGAENTIGVPNVFSPNDDGFNDLLEIEAPAFDDIKSFAIFDRWGHRVFYSNTIRDSWDGLVNGKPAQQGVYIYSLQAVCPENNKIIVKSGDITVLR